VHETEAGNLYSKYFVDQENIWFHAFIYTSISHICYVHKSKTPEKYPFTAKEDLA